MCNKVELLRILKSNEYPHHKEGSKEFQNSYSSAFHFALVLQLDKEGKSTCPDQVFPSKNQWMSGFFGLCKGL